MRFLTPPVVPIIVLGCVLVARFSPGTPHNPAIDPSHALSAYVAVPAPVQRIFQRSCYDCHSNQTRWPWYSSIPGVSNMLQSHIAQARKHLNLTDWSAKVAEGPDEAQAALNGICEELRADSMPLKSYRWLHREAQLSPEEVETVCRWSASPTSQK